MDYNIYDPWQLIGPGKELFYLFTTMDSTSFKLTFIDINQRAPRKYTDGMKFDIQAG